MIGSGGPSGIITLLTDFGLKDPFVGVMKGVILGRFRNATIVDLTHEIAPQDVSEGGFWLEHAHGWFPRGTVHIAVVDPGVGTERRALAAEVGGHTFVAPDNGLLGGLLERADDAVVRLLDLERLDLVPASRTFHGRDVFAPVGAALAAARWGVKQLGPATSWLPSPRAQPKLVEFGWCGCVATVDHFGNLITDLRTDRVEGSTSPILRAAGQELASFATFAEAAIGQAFAYPGSFGTWEIAVRNGSAARDLGLGRGAPVELHLHPCP